MSSAILAMENNTSGNSNTAMVIIRSVITLTVVATSLWVMAGTGLGQASITDRDRRTW